MHTKVDIQETLTDILEFLQIYYKKVLQLYLNLKIISLYNTAALLALRRTTKPPLLGGRGNAQQLHGGAGRVLRRLRFLPIYNQARSCEL